MNKFFALLIVLATSPTYAATFYVDCTNGNDANSGRSHNLAWKSVDKVNTSVKTSGDDVYFKAGCTWRDRLEVDWGGTSTNRAVVGSYYMNAGKETIGVPSGTNKPTFQGTCVSGTNCPYNKSDSVPNSEWKAMIGIRGNYTTVKNLRVKNSSGRGIDVIGTVSGNQKYNNNHILDNTIDHTLRSGIFLNRTSHSSIVRGNNVSKTAVIFPYGWHKDWPAAISMGISNKNIIENNYIHNTFGEGIGVYASSHYNIVRNNVVIKGNKAGIYVSCSNNNIVENNKVLGDRKDFFYASKDGFPNVDAYGAASEAYCKADTKNNIFRNNLAANVRGCFTNNVEVGAAADGYKVINEFYNNTCVNAANGFVTNSNGGASNAYAIFKNNILTKVKNTCLQVNSTSKLDHNHWDVTPTDSDCQGPNDVIGDPRLKVSSGWESVGVANLPPDENFNVQADSRAHDAGTTLTTTISAASTGYPQSNLLAGSCKLDLSKNLYDRKCIKRSSNDAIGAFSSNTTSSITLQTPSGLSLQIDGN